MDKFLEWFNSRDDVTELRKSVGGWKSDRSTRDHVKKSGGQSSETPKLTDYDKSTGYGTNSVKKSKQNFSPMTKIQDDK